MSAILISYPFRLATNGEVVIRPDSDDDYYAEELAGLIQTVPGERPLVPDYGIEDPVYNEWPEEDLAAKIDLFGPPVEVEELYIEFMQDGIADMVLKFQSRPGSLNEDDDYDIDEEDLDEEQSEADVYSI